MDLDTLAAEILQQFPDLKDWKQPELILLAKAVKKLGRAKRKELKESIKKAKKEKKAIAKQEKRERKSREKEADKKEREIIRENRRKERKAKKQLGAKRIKDEEIIKEMQAAERKIKAEEFTKMNNQEEEVRQRLARIINEEADQKLKDKLQGIRQKWETRNNKKLEKERRHWENRMILAKLPKSKQNILNRMNAKLSRMSIKLNLKLIGRLKDIKETYEMNYPKQATGASLAAGQKDNSALKPDQEEIRPKRKYVRRQQACGQVDPQEIKKKAEVKKRNRQTRKESGSSPDTVRYIFRGASKKKLLTGDEEKALSKKIQGGDKKALDEFIEKNLRLVINVAAKYISSGVPLEDLIGYGNIGLIKAARRFRGDKNCKFSTYATYWIRQQVERSIVDFEGNIIRLPIHQQTDINKMRKAFRELETELGREPEAKELAEKMKMSEKKIYKLQKLKARNFFELEAPTGKGRDKSDQNHEDVLEDMIIPPPAKEVEKSDSQKHLKKEVRDGLDTLEEIERAILTKRFGDEKYTLEQLGKEFGVTRERIRQIQNNALDRLGDYFRRTGKEGLLKALIA